MSLPPSPQCLGDFEIARELGRGGMGVVYEARQRSLNRPVALKVLAPGLGLTARAVERFRREAEAAAKLHHTNIVPVYATGEQDNVHFYAMELIAGPSLDHVLNSLREPGSASATAPELAATGPYAAGGAPPSASGPGRLSGSGSDYFDAVARTIAEVADALDYAHRQGVIHRDVKPSNLLLAPDGRLSLNDFGLARVLEQPGMTVTGEFVGTPAYMSPEQVTSGRVPVDHRTDIYSLGATLYEMLTLRPPFGGQRRDQVLAQIIQKDPTPPRKLNKRVPRDLETICLKALDKDPDRRYQTAGQMADDLRRYVNRFAIAAKRAGPLERLRKWVRRHPAASAALAVALLAVAAAGFFAYRAHEAERRHREELEQRLAEKRQNALDKAYAAAMGGNFEAANGATAEAERLGATTGEVRLLRGLIAYYDGKTEDALEHFEQAVRLMPQSVAAHALLAVAYSEVSRWADYFQTLAKAEQLPAVTRDDYLFKGYAESVEDPDKGLRTLHEAAARGNSPVVRLIRGQVYLNIALYRGGVAAAESAIEDADAARTMLDDNPNPLTLRLSARIALANACAKAGDDQRRREVLARAEQDAEALKRYRDILEVLVERFLFFRGIGEETVVEDELRRAVEKTGNSAAVYCYAMLLYRKGEVEKAAAVLEQHHADPILHPLWCYVLAELPDGAARSRRVCEELAARDLWAWSMLKPLAVWRFLGDAKAAEAESRRCLKHPERLPILNRETVRQLLEYTAGNLSLDEFEKSLGDSTLEQCEGHFHIAMVLLSQRDRAGALRHFQSCVDSGAFTFVAYDLALIFRERLMNDPRWPRTIPVKE
jgi:tetratricopeptide (TPR) repeat protein